MNIHESAIVMMIAMLELVSLVYELESITEDGSVL